MFCLGCGAEASPGAAKCSVCGRDLGRVTGADSRRAAPAAPSGSYTSYSLSTQMPALTRVSMPGATTALETLALPQDMHGRAVLVTVIAMAADLLLPWIVMGDSHRSIISVGAPALVALPILGAALLPVLFPALRRQPAYAVLPMVTGALCAGAGATLWAVLTYLSYRLSFIATIIAGTPASTDTSGDPIASSSITAPFSMSPDAGIYFFMLGGVVLIFMGYTLFLAAARGASSPVTTVPTVAAPAPASVPLSPAQPALPPYLQPQPDLSSYLAPAPASIPLAAGASRPTPAAAAQAVPANGNGYEGQPGALPSPSMRQAALPDATQGNVPASMPLPPAPPPPALPPAAAGLNPSPQNDALHVPLPGSAEWNEAPRQPEHMRPSPGWQRGPRMRR